MSLHLVPIGRDVAFAFIADHHRHHLPPQGYKFAIGVADEDGIMRGVVVVGRPVARHLDDGWCAEVTRCCTDGTKNAPSMLYAAAWRAARAMGYVRLITYVLESEPGTSVKAAGWTEVGAAGGGSWSRKGRPRVDKAPTEQKTLWEVK